MGKFLDKFLDTASTLSPTLGEMRWNQLQRDYDREVGSESYGSSSDYSFDFESMYYDVLRKAKELASSEEASPELPPDVSASEIDIFLDDAETYLMPLLDCGFELEEDFYELEYIECDADDYDDSGFETESKAKAECRKSIKAAIEDVKEQYESERDYLISAAESEFDCLKVNLSSIKDEFYKTFMESVEDSFCDDDAKKYIVKRFNDLYEQWNAENSNVDDGIDRMYSAKVDKAVKAYFKNAEADLSKPSDLLDMCDISEDWDEEYEYSTEEACSTLVEEYTSILEEALEELPEIMYEAYAEVTAEHAAKLYKLLYMLK